MYGVREFAAIINPPHATILAVGASRRAPVEAADGSLWLWPDTRDYTGALFKAPKQLEFLGNVLGKAD